MNELTESKTPQFVRGSVYNHPMYGTVPVLVDIHNKVWLSASTLRIAYGYSSDGMNKATRKFVSEQNRVTVTSSELLKLFAGVAVVHLGHKKSDKTKGSDAADGAEKQLFFNPNVNQFFNEEGSTELALHSGKPQAEEFRRWIANEVLPQIRHTGSYFDMSGIDKDMLDEEDYEEMADVKRFVQRHLNKIRMKQELMRNKPKVDYVDIVLNCTELVTTKTVAEDYGMSAYELHNKAHDMGILYPVKDNDGHIIQWHPYKGFEDWVKNVTVPYPAQGSPTGYGVCYYLKWTQTGRYNLYRMFKQEGILPLIECPEEIGE